MYKEEVQELIGWISMGITILSFFGPVPIYINVIRGKINFEDAPGGMVIIYYINYFCWYIYGFMIFSDQIQYGYMTGWIICLILMIIYLCFEIKKYFVDTIFNIIILITGTWTLYHILMIVIDDDKYVGFICIITSCIVYFFPIQTIINVIYGKNFMIIPIYYSFIRLLYASGWLVYGSFIREFNVVIPNVIGLFLSLIEIIIFFSYKKKYPFFSDKDFISTIVIENNPNEESKEETPIKDVEETEIKGKPKPVKIKSGI